MKPAARQARGEISPREQRLAEQRAERTQGGAEARASRRRWRGSRRREGRAADAAPLTPTRAAPARSCAAPRGARSGRGPASLQPSGGWPRLAPVPSAAAGEPTCQRGERPPSWCGAHRDFYDAISAGPAHAARAFDKIHRPRQRLAPRLAPALLEGVPGYYRIRVATDVRLIYRRDGPAGGPLLIVARTSTATSARPATRPA